MPQLIANCPRCGAKNIATNAMASHYIGQEHGWMNFFEVYCVCTGCLSGTIFVVKDKDYTSKHHVDTAGGMFSLTVALNNYFDIDSYIGLRHMATTKPPEHVPEPIADAFSEAATCLTTECWNAAAAMFRLCVDLATSALLPEGDTESLNAKTRRDLGLRLPWLFENERLPQDLHELSTCIKEDGNDGVHRGTIEESDALDMLEFTVALLERLYTAPRQIEINKERRAERRNRGQ